MAIKIQDLENQQHNTAYSEQWTTDKWRDEDKARAAELAPLDENQLDGVVGGANVEKPFVTLFEEEGDEGLDSFMGDED